MEEKYNYVHFNLGTKTCPRYTLYRWLNGPQSRSGRGDEKKNSLPLPGIETRSSSR
jgi:hypothetical protein